MCYLGASHLAMQMLCQCLVATCVAGIACCPKSAKEGVPVAWKSSRAAAPELHIQFRMSHLCIAQLLHRTSC